MISRSLTLLVLSALAGMASAAPNLIVNGSFEDVTLPGKNWDQFSSILGWSATSGKIEVGKASVYGVTGQTGNNVLELDSTMNSVVSQNLNLTSGYYALSFDFAKRNGTSNATNAFDVLWNGNVVASLTPTSTAFSNHQLVLGGISGMNTLSFRGMGASDSYGGMIDNVSVQAVPEPASIAALGAGALGLLRRRKKA